MEIWILLDNSTLNGMFTFDESGKRSDANALPGTSVMSTGSAKFGDCVYHEAQKVYVSVCDLTELEERENSLGLSGTRF